MYTIKASSLNEITSDDNGIYINSNNTKKYFYAEKKISSVSAQKVQ